MAENMNLFELSHSELADLAYDFGFENAWEMSEHELRDILADCLDSEE